MIPKIKELKDGLGILQVGSQIPWLTYLSPHLWLETGTLLSRPNGMKQRLSDALVPPPYVPLHVPRRLRNLVAHVVQPLRNALDKIPSLFVSVVGHLGDLLDVG